MNNGWVAIVYDRLLSKHTGDDTALRSYTLDAALKPQSGQILTCDEKGEGCKAHPLGEVHISGVTETEVTGQMVVRFGEHRSTYPFRLERLAHKGIPCG